MTATDRQTDGEFRRIGDVVDFGTRLADLDRIRKQRRNERFALYRWPEGTSCAECGDTGYPPDAPGETCLTCQVGRDEQEQLNRRARWQRIVPRRFAEYTLSSHPNREMAEQVRNWAANDSASGSNLILVGLTARGKTGLAIGALRTLYSAGKSVKFSTVPDILTALRPRSDGDQSPAISLYSLQATPVLLMDDLGTEKMSEFVSEQLYAIVNGRYERSFPTIVTCNSKLDEIAESVGDRIYSRLMEDATILAVTGPDLRSR